MHNVTGLRKDVERAQEGVHQRLQMLGADGWQADDSHPDVLLAWWGEVGPAVRCYMVTHARESLPHLFVISLDAAVLRNHATSADEGDSERGFLKCSRTFAHRKSSASGTKVFSRGRRAALSINQAVIQP